MVLDYLNNLVCLPNDVSVNYNRQYLIGFDEEHETQITASIFDSFLFNSVLSSQEINNIMTNGKPYVPTNKLIAEEFVRTGPYGKNQSPNDKHNITINIPVN